MVTQQELHGNWNRWKGVIQEKWGQLTDDDLARVKGNVNQLFGMIQQKTGDTRETIQSFFDSAMSDTAGTVDRAAEAVRSYATGFANVAQEKYENAGEALNDGMNSAQETVRRHPAESVAVCFGAGLIAGAVLGLLLRNRA